MCTCVVVGNSCVYVCEYGCFLCAIVWWWVLAVYNSMSMSPTAHPTPTNTSAQYRSNTGKGTSQKSFYRLDIDIQRNEPNIYKEQLLPNPQGWFGAEVSVTIAGNWQYYRAKILRYLRQIAVITPYAEVGGVARGCGV